MKQFHEFLREHAMKIVNFEKKGNGTINKNKQKESYEKRKICYICKKIINVKLKTIVIILVNTEVLNIVYVI